jgi:acetylglutamate kinase
MMVVVKLGGRVQSDPRLAGAIRRMWEARPGSLCIVHGGGDEVSSLQRQLGREPQFIGGRRVTTDEDLGLLRMVLSGSANKRLVSALAAEGVPAVGISGEDGGLIPARAIDPASFGKAGKPLEPDVRLLSTLLERKFLPVISPVGTDAESSDRGPLNINGDDAAAAIAAALGAELWLIADVAGVLDRDKRTIPALDPPQVESLVASGVVNSGMQAKLEAGFAAIHAGAAAVRIASLEAFTDAEAGTVLSLSPSLR